MQITKSKEALRRLLVNSFPGIDIAIENIPYESNHERYLAVQFVVNPPTDPTYGPYYYRENISFQIFVSDRLGIGTTEAEELAEQVRDVFYKGLSLQEDQYRLHILRTPHIAGAKITADRLVVPVLIPVQVEVFKA